jgi:hypothetical protein
MTTTQSTEATRATFKGHGSPEMFYYFGYGSTPRSEGILARVTDESTLVIVNAVTGEGLQYLSRQSKIWAAPAN